MNKRSIVCDAIDTNNVEFDITGISLVLEEWIDCVKYYIHKIADNSLHGTEVGNVLADALNSSGKLIRPRLLLLCAALGPSWKKLQKRLCILAAMVELTHLASLIHDDIIDEAKYRRGQLSIQSKYGKSAAVYAGDFLMSRIYYYEAIEHLNESAAVLSNAVEQMCCGEIGQALCQFKETITIEEYFCNIKGKTAALFKTACHIGATEAGCTKDIVKKLETFGENLGIMFQLRDDLLDFTSDSMDIILKEIGKETHKDFKNGIYTMPVIMAMKHPTAKKTLLPLVHENSSRALTTEEIKKMETYVITYGGIEDTYNEIRRLANINKKILCKLDENNDSVPLIHRLMSLLEV